MKISLCLVSLLSLFLMAPAFAFLPPEDTVGPLTVKVADPGPVTALGQPINVAVTLTNTGAAPLQGTLRVWGTDDWKVLGEATRPFVLAGKATRTLPYQIVAGKSTYVALYPLHAQATLQSGAAAHAILILSVASEAVPPSPVAWPLLKAPRHGNLRLDAPDTFRPGLTIRGENPSLKPVGWQGLDDATGTDVRLAEVDRGSRRRAIAVHPPWRQGWGETYLDYRVQLPATRPLRLEFATAIRDSSGNEPQSDGVEFKVLVDGGNGFKPLFERFSDAKRWQPASVDLSEYSGRDITLRLVTGPGPARNTSVDQAYWSAPVLVAGTPPRPEAAAQKAVRRQRAQQAAQAARKGNAGNWAWRLQNNNDATGAAIVPGPNGLADAFIAFSGSAGGVVFDGFKIELDGQQLGAGPSELWIESVEPKFAARRATLTHRVLRDNRPLDLQAQIWAEQGVLRMKFSLPGATRNAKGEPRFTTLMIGPASTTASRVYAGFGNVLQNPGKFDLHAGGFTLSTSHVGMDFAGGLSLVQASDIFPDYFHVDSTTCHYALATHHDATLSFVPSSSGAFAAARVYRQIAGFKPAPGVAQMLGKMCLDQWGGDYARQAAEIEAAARYGLTDSVFVKHVWQRWGYDYRLPEIYPPEGNVADFQKLVAACKQSGILFCPHDNYIDFYPDAQGFSYDHIIFNADGTPQKAWFNEGRDALSYRWLPTAFMPWLEANVKLVKNGFDPDAYFVDVFAAIAPMDFYDRQGRFYPKTVTTARWGAAFDRIREVLGDNAPMISEAGHDALIGHLDAGQADHYGWHASGDAGNPAWKLPADDGERVPWHDMVSHGEFVLLGGGLGGRYADGENETLHGYGSDDYLSLTVLGGRNPMSDGPFNRRAVATYWLLHDLCAGLARRELLSHQFDDDDIHRQTTRFGTGDNATGNVDGDDTATVRVNRGESDWQTEGKVLPRYGFTAQAGASRADISRRDGLISAFAAAPGDFSADARPVAAGLVRPRVLGVEDLGQRRFRLRVAWDVMGRVPEGYRPFLHFVDDQAPNEGIVFQGGLDLDPARLQQPGTHESTAEVTWPDDAPRTVEIRLGLWNPEGGGRFPLMGPTDNNGRSRGGAIARGENEALSWQPAPPTADDETLIARLNTAGKVLDFGPVATNGAFGLEYSGGTWQLTPLPDSPAFEVTLHLNQMGAAGRRPRSITPLVYNQNTKLITALPALTFQQRGDMLSFRTAADVFAYRIQW